MSDKLNELIHTATASGRSAFYAEDVEELVAALEQQFGVEYVRTDAMVALEQRVEGLKTYAMLLEGKVSPDLLDWLLRTRRLLGLEVEMATWLIPDEHREALAAEIKSDIRVVANEGLENKDR